MTSSNHTGPDSSRLKEPNPAQTEISSHPYHARRRVQPFVQQALDLNGLSSRPLIQDVNATFDKKLTLGQRLADAIAAGMGSWYFIIIQSTILLIWISLNVTGWIERWDPYPFILLNLALSFQAAYAAPIIMMSQNRQSDKDRLAAQNDYEVNKLGEVEIQAVLLHLEEQDRLLINILERLDQQQIGSNSTSSEINPLNEIDKTTAFSPMEAKLSQAAHFEKPGLNEIQRTRIEHDLWASVKNSLQHSQLSPQQVLKAMDYCHSLINLESFQRNHLVDEDFKLDEHKIYVFSILFKEALTSLGGKYDQPTRSDLEEVSRLLIERMKYRGMDQELIDKYAEVSQQLIAKIK